MAGNQTLTVTVRIRADGTTAVKEVRKVQGSVSKLTSTLGRNIAAFAATTLSIRALGRGISASVRLFQEQEDAVRKLDAALAPLGGSAAAVSNALQQQASALQEVTRFGDETIIQGQALIASFTKNTEEIKKATAAALDLSAATGQSLQSAFLLLGRAAAGETSQLSRYGILLDESIPKTERFAAALEAINAQFGGQAVAQAETFRGAVERLSNAWGDLGEVLGEQIGTSETVIGSINRLRESIENATQTIPNFLRGIRELSAEIEPLPGFFEGTADGFERFSTGAEPVITALQAIARETENAGRIARDNENLEESIAAGRKRIAEERLDALNKETEAVFRARDAQEFWNGVLKEAEQIFDDSNSAAARFDRSADEITDVFKELGITLEKDLREELEELETTQNKVTEAWRNGIIETADYERAIESLGQKQQRLKEELGESDEALIILDKRYKQGKISVDEYTESVAALEDQQNRTNESLRDTSFIIGQGLGGRPLFENLSGSGGSYSYNTRVAAPTVSGGVQFFNAARGRRII